MLSNIVFLGGLPRTGSTLLTAILGENPDIHTEGTSALCQLMWDTQVSFENNEQLGNKPEIADKILSKIPELFYENINSLIIDKFRHWALPANLNLIQKYITPNPKLIIMTRPLVDIVKSFVHIRTLNGVKDPEFSLLDEHLGPIVRPYIGVQHARNTDGQFLFLEYDDLLTDTIKNLRNIYEFLELPYFEHNLEHISNRTPEKGTYRAGLIGLHDIRPIISKREINVVLSQSILDQITALEERYLVKPSN